MGEVSFVNMMTNQMNLFARRKVAMALGSTTDRNSYEMLFALKMMLATIDTLNEGKGSPQVRPFECNKMSKVMSKNKVNK